MDDVAITRVSGPDGDVEAFVLNSWLESYKRRARMLHNISDTEFYRTHHPELTRLLRKSDVLLAHLRDEPDVYLGWACGSPGVLHYVYVKSAFRLSGVCNALINVCASTRPGPLIYTFEPGTQSGDPRASLLAVAERRGYKFHPHPIPGVEVLKQHQEKPAP